MPANCLAPITKCTYKKAQQQIKEEAFQDSDFTQKAHQYLSSSDALENINTFYESTGREYQRFIRWRRYDNHQMRKYALGTHHYCP